MDRAAAPSRHPTRRSRRRLAAQGRAHDRPPHGDRAREQLAGGFLPDPEHPGELPEPPAPGGELADRAIERLHHRTELAALPARQRRLLALQAFGLSYAEIAAREGCTPRTVERQLLRAKRALRDADPQP
ncbi:MAG: sigma factor-like helix-turn-helix DNA-binding protein [Solirubrobacteraceae bacterium]